ncbi:MBL fold metallo-hydrolase [Polynucleobacter sp. IMCC 30228]|uniref:MBL fold metallo-hydrolase n=1 Tax=Polynucleobacter sp. IMCC 30228 TaxID=2781011 RepID=UPI001F190536|nr:MBL fold metallo-hydrolase [Polynucleobacter sp. IMCC 30228]MCE7527238.1 MBL fold metallo-hydrolase [Polynucleobacter sp. IMCC 30228]
MLTLSRNYGVLFLGLFCQLALAQGHRLIDVSDTVPNQIQPIEVAKQVYFVQGLPEMGSAKNQNFISNAGFVITPKGVVVIDALGSPILAEQLLQKIKLLTPQKVVAVIVTHYHADHIYGLQVFRNAGAVIYANENGKLYLTADAAQQRLISSRQDFAPWVNQNTKLIAADHWVKDRFTLVVGGVEFLLIRAGPAHTAEDLLVYVPSKKVLFVGDLVFNGRIPFVGNADSQRWIASLQQIEKLQAAIIVPGHGAYSNNPPRDIAFTSEYLRYLRHSMAPAARNLDSFDEAYQATNWGEYEGMPLFRAANRMNAYNVYLSIQEE